MRKLRNNELGRLSTEDFKNSEKTPLIIVADNVRSFHNVGVCSARPIVFAPRTFICVA